MNKPSCFGQYMHKECEVNGGHHECKTFGYMAESEQTSCHMHTNQAFGMCDCEYKRYCHEMRQLCQVKYGPNDKQKCDVYQMFIVDFKPGKPLDISGIDISINPIAEIAETKPVKIHLKKRLKQWIKMWIRRRLFIFWVKPELFWKWIWSRATRTNGKICDCAGDCINYIGCGPELRCGKPCRYCLYWLGYPNRKEDVIENNETEINF